MYKCSKCGWEGIVNGRQRCLACYRLRIKEWRERNPDKARAQRSRWNKKFRETRREEFNARRRRLRNKESGIEMYKRRIKWLLSGNVTRQELIEIYERQKGQCSYCNKPVKCFFNPLHLRGFDHIKPRSKGGKHEKNNIVVSCGRCNAIKRDK